MCVCTRSAVMNAMQSTHKPRGNTGVAMAGTTNISGGSVLCISGNEVANKYGACRCTCGLTWVWLFILRHTNMEDTIAPPAQYVTAVHVTDTGEFRDEQLLVDDPHTGILERLHGTQGTITGACIEHEIIVTSPAGRDGLDVAPLPPLFVSDYSCLDGGPAAVVGSVILRVRYNDAAGGAAIMDDVTTAEIISLM